jgi:hypothetical protein
MIAIYPKFLSKSPRFMGLGLHDLIFLGIILSVCFFLKLQGLYGLGVTLILLIAKKLLFKFLDLRAFVYANHKKSLVISDRHWEKS